MESDHCTALAHPNIPTFSLSVFIVFGILISYLPQHYRIISRRSSEGLSPYFVLLGTTSSTFAIANILTLPASQADIGCCKEISGVACLAGLLGIAQVAVQWACFNLIMLLFLIFFPAPGPEPHPADAPPPPTYKDALTVVFICGLHTTIIIILSAIFLLWVPGALQTWATLLGVCAAILACIQYLPQLWTTYKLQHVMSLSVPMMCIQTPGSFIFAASLGMRLGWEGWSAWGVYIVTGILQGGLLFMGIQFELRDARQRREAGGEGAQWDEQAPLLGNGNENGNGNGNANGHSQAGSRSYAAVVTGS